MLGNLTYQIKMLIMSAHVIVVFICVLRILFACNISAFLSFATDFKNLRILIYFLVLWIRFKSRLLRLILLLILLFPNTCKKEQFLMLSFTTQSSFFHFSDNEHGMVRLHVPTRVFPWFHPATYILNHTNTNLNS